MKCPACSRELVEVKVGSFAVDVCQGGCGGIWFDNRELQKVDEADELNIEPLLGIVHNLDVNVDFNARRQCPRCGDVVLMRQGYAGNREVEVDTCASCAGVWLDGGELALIRNRPEEADRKQAATEYFKRLFEQDWARLRRRPA